MKEGPTRKDGDKKFSMNQNLTVLLVFFKTLSIMIEANRYQIGHERKYIILYWDYLPHIKDQMQQ